MHTILRRCIVNKCIYCRKNTHLETKKRKLEGKVALVTGSTSGIGLGIAENLATQGCHVVLNGFGEPKGIEEITTNLQSHGVNANHFGEDLSSEEGNVKLSDNILQIYPSGIDILINNAGVQHVSPVESFSLQKWNQMLGIMLTSPFLLTQTFLPGMRKSGWGRIVNIASVHGMIASPQKAAYVAAKHGLLGLTKVVALETAGSGVTCNAVCPGFVDTSIFQKQVQDRANLGRCSYEEASKRILQTVHPTCQPVEIQQVAKFVEFICSDAASQMTGSSLTMDAGWTAR